MKLNLNNRTAEKVMITFNEKRMIIKDQADQEAGVQKIHNYGNIKILTLWMMTSNLWKKKKYLQKLPNKTDLIVKKK